MPQLQAILNTTSNYKNCNGQTVTVVEIFGQTVVCLVPAYGYDKDGPLGDKWINCDFKLTEIKSFSNIKFEK